MNPISPSSKTEKCIAQLIDANLDRAREGLRVIEDWCRFGLGNKELVIEIKDFRQRLGIHHKEIYKLARSTKSDPGIGISHPLQNKRIIPTEIISANCARVEEALRVLEEFTRTSNPELSRSASSIRYHLYDIEVKILEKNIQEINRKKLIESNLYLITKTHPDMISKVETALEIGIKIIQYRSTKTSDKQKLIESKKLRSICDKHKALLIINNRVDIAIASNADGVHLGQEDLPIDFAKQQLGPDKIIGMSTHSLEQIKESEKYNCDYIGVGPIYRSKTKLGAQANGIKLAKDALKNYTKPWFAIGGIDTKNIQELKSIGSKKFAIADAIMSSKDIKKTTLYLLEATK
tara:strand:+ start:81 stop:1127 length:1047 start_codon:yes stop_codon:yes gene_type:complete